LDAGGESSLTGVLSVNAFHEKAGRSQVGSFVFSLDKSFSPAELPLSLPFHPHSLLSDFVSLGASWVFSFQPLLPPDCRPLSVSRRKWARRLTQSPELGFWAFDFSFLRMF
jgi:hypothetical protein